MFLKCVNLKYHIPEARHQLKFKLSRSKNNNTHKRCLSLSKSIDTLNFFQKQPITIIDFAIKIIKNQIHPSL